MGDAQAMVDLHLRSDRSLSVLGLGVLVIPFVWFVRTDLELFSHDATTLSVRLVARMLLVMMLLGGIALVRRAPSRRSYSTLILALSTLTASAVIVLTGLRPDGSGVPLRSPLFVIAVMYAALPNTLWRQVVPPFTLSVGLLFLETGRLRAADTDVAGDVVILAALSAAGLLIVRRRIQLEAEVESAWDHGHAARRAEAAALRELRTLQGIIPICAYCKSVRTEQGAWQQIERYVHERSAAEFSHGICPECMRHKYPDIAGG